MTPVAPASLALAAERKYVEPGMMYDGWRISKWETPVGGIRRLLMVSLADVDRELVIVFEDPAGPGRPRWRVRFRQYPGYRNLDEAYRIDLWRWLDESGQRCGFTFTVEESPPFASWGTGYDEGVSPGTRHFVVATEDDVVEVLAAEEPIWETAEAAEPGSPLPGKARHLYLGEDDVEIEALCAELNEPKKRD